MKTLPRIPLVLAASMLMVATAWAAAPVVSKVEPPSWWIGHSWSPVRLLIDGRDLTGAQLTTPEGLSAGQATVSTNGNWALVDLTIAPNATAGRRVLKLTTPTGSAAVPFELLRRQPPEGRFQGFGPEDVIYLAMPDRFANGDTANDNPVTSPGLFDRTKPRHYHGGDLAGVIQHLPYLQQLGVTAIWLTPWYDNVNHLNDLEKYTADNRRSADGVPSTDYHGYGAVDYYGVEEHFGDLSTLRNLVAAAHYRGLKVIQDQVANHTGPRHPWAARRPV